MATEICITRNMPQQKHVRQKSNDMSADVRKNGLKREKLPNHLKKLLYKISIERFKSISLLLRTLRSVLQSIKKAVIQCLLSQLKNLFIEFRNFSKESNCRICTGNSL